MATILSHVLALIIVWSRFQQVISTATVLPSDDPDGCKKIKDEGIGDCAACISSLPEETSCTRTALQDAETERVALFKTKSGTKLWNDTLSFFATDAVNEVDIQLSRNNWQILQTDPAQEVYVSGAVVIAGSRAEQVGVRFNGKGAIGACVAGSAHCEKLTWKFRFNKFDRTRTFHGLKRFMMHAAIYDRTVGMRERLTNSLWREMGVPAPRQVHVRAKLTIDKGTVHEQTYNLGIHLLTDQIDGRFTETVKASGDKGDGNLFKETWPGFGSVSEATFRASLRTNEDVNLANGGTDIRRLVYFGEELQQATNDYDLAVLMKKYTRAKEWASYWVVDRAVENWDGPISFRVSQDSGGTEAYWNHNYYLYQTDETSMYKQEFRLFGWDVESTWINDTTLNYRLGANNVSDRKAWDMPVGTCGDKCVQCQTYSTSGGTRQQMPAGCFSTVRAFARGLREHYMNASMEFLQGPFQLCRLLSKIDRWRTALAPYIAQDVTDGLYPVEDYCTLNGTFTWDSEVANFRNTIVTDYVSRFRASVSCDRDYNSNDWAPLSAATNKPIAPMDGNSNSQAGQWLPNWLKGDQCGAISTTRELYPPITYGPTAETTTTAAAGTGQTSEAPATTVAIGPGVSGSSATEVTGSLTATVSDPAAFAASAEAKLSARQAIADNNQGITTSMVEVLSITVARRLRHANNDRRLAGAVQINYRIVIPANANVVIPTTQSMQAIQSQLATSLSSRLTQNGVTSITVTAVVANTVSSSVVTTTIVAEQKKSEDENSNVVVILVAIVGSLVGVGLIAGGLWFFCRKGRRATVIISDGEGTRQKPVEFTPQVKGEVAEKPVIVVGAVAKESETKMTAVVPDSSRTAWS